MLLNARLGSPSAGSVLANLAQQPWERPATESVRDFVARLDKQAQGRSDEAKARLDETLEQLGKLARRPTPLGWRTQREMWLELVELMLLTKSDQDVIARWQQAATTHAEVANLYRMAHVLSVREAKAGKLDYNFVKPLFHGARRGPERMRWTAETLTTLLATSVEADAPERVEARKTLLDDLRDSSQPVYAESDLVGSLGELYLSARASKESEAASLLETILTHCHSSFFVQFANQAGIPAVEQRQLLLAKPVRVTADHDTLAKAINYLAQQAGTPLWIDLEMAGQGSDVPVAACDGPWLVTVKKVLSGTEYRLHLLSPDLFWIGHADQFESARKAYLDGFSKSRWADAKPAAALMDSTRMEFIETPLSQVLDFLRDQHDISLVLLGTDDPPVTLNLSVVPLHVALTVMTQSLECDWCADRGVVFVGPREQLQRVELGALPGLRRWARVGMVDSAVTKALRDETRMEFIETPLEQVAQFLSDQHQVPVRVAESHASGSGDAESQGRHIGAGTGHPVPEARLGVGHRRPVDFAGGRAIRRAAQGRLSLRERTFSRGAKDDSSSAAPPMRAAARVTAPWSCRAWRFRTVLP